MTQPYSANIITNVTQMKFITGVFYSSQVSELLVQHRIFKEMERAW